MKWSLLVLTLVLFLAVSQSSDAAGRPAADLESKEIGMESLSWRVTMPGAVDHVLQDGRAIIAGVEGGRLFRISPSDGSVVWSGTLAKWRKSSGRLRITEVDRERISSLEKSGKLLAAVTESNRIYFLDPGTGSILARAAKPWEEHAIYDSLLAARSDKAVVCKNCVTGKRIWTLKLPEPVESIRSSGDRIAVLTAKKLEMISFPSGKVIASLPLQGFSSLIAFKGYLYTQEAGYLTARDPATLRALWRSFIPLTGVSLKESGNLLMADTGKGYAILSRKDGRVLSRGKPTDKGERFSLYGSYLVMFSNNAAAVCEAEKGKKIWERQFPDVITSCSGDGARLYVTAGNRMEIFSMGDGTLLARRSFRNYLGMQFIDGTPVLLKGETDLALPAPGRKGIRRFQCPPYLCLDLEKPSIVSGRAAFQVSGRALDTIMYTAHRASKIVYKKDALDPEKSVYEARAAHGWSGTVDFDGAVRTDLQRAPLEKPGLYRITARSRNLTRTGYVLFSQLGIVVKFGPRQLLVHVENMKSHSPQENAIVTVEGKKGAVIYKGKPGTLNLAPSGDLKITARLGEDFAVYRRAGLGVPELGSRLYLYTDRPVYRPGQEVHFKGIARKMHDAGYEALRHRKAEISVRDTNDAVIWKGAQTTNAMGSFKGEVTLPEEAALGDYSIVTTMDGRTFYDSFKVSAYRKPEFKVELVPSHKFYIQQEHAVVGLKAQYYAGGPLRNRPVKFTVRASAHRFPVKSPVEEASWYAPEEEGGGRWLFVLEGTTTTDSKGEAVIELDCKTHKEDVMYRIEAVVTDRDNRPAAGETSFPVPRADLFITPYTERHIFRPGEDIPVKVKATDTLGNPVLTPVEVMLRDPVWRGGKWTYDIIAREKITTDEKGEGTARFRTDRAGYLNVRVEGADEGGRPTDGETYVWLSGYAQALDETPSLKIVSDRRFYLPGETARLIINTKAAGKTALVTVEGNRIYRAFFVPLRGASTYLELPLAKEYEPNVYVCVAIVHNGDLVRGSLLVPVLARDKFLALTLTRDKEIYRPGETAQLTLTAKDSKGLPVEGEFSLGVVDASIYAIAPDLTPDIRRFFYGRRENLIITDFFIPQEYLAGGTQKVPEKPKAVRKKFLDTAYWNPFVITDRSGQARIAVPLPDNLTTWRATVRGVTASTDVGSTTGSVRVTKDIILRLSLPRFFTQGDRERITAMVQNTTDMDREVEVRLALEGIDLAQGESAIKTVKVKKGAVTAVAWDLSVEGYPPRGAAVVTGWARALDESGKPEGEKLQDALELTVPVKPCGEKIAVYEAGIVEKEAALTFTVPDDAIPQASSLRLAFSPSPAAQILGSLEYLASYPYGCTEQTMSSFLPDVVFAGAMKKAGIRNEKLEKEIPAMVSKGFALLYGYQHSDGGWGWWKTDESDPFLTGYVLTGLAYAREAGFTVDDVRVRSGAQRALSFFQQTEDLNVRAYLLYALALHGFASGDSAYEFYKETTTPEGKKKFNLYGRALLARAFHILKDDARAREILEGIRKEAVEATTSCWWEVSGSEYGWMEDVIETNAIILQAMIEIAPSDPLISKVVRYLMSRRRGNAWTSTKDTAQILIALAKYVPLHEERDVNYTFDVVLNGATVKRVSVTSESLATPETVIRMGFPSLKTGGNTLLLRKSGKGTLHYTASFVNYLKKERIPPGGRGLTVNRAYRMQVKGRLESVDLDRDILQNAVGSGSEKIAVGLNSSDQIVFVEPRQVPDLYNEVYNRTTVGTYEPYDESATKSVRFQAELSIDVSRTYEYVIVEDCIPSGFEIENVQEQVFFLPPGEKEWKELRASRRENRDDRAAFFFTRLPRGKVFIRYTLRCENSGVLRALPARAELMYVPEMFGSSGEGRFTVLPADRKAEEPEERE